MPAVAVWTIALLVVVGVVGLMTLMAVGLGRASSQADDESERQMAEYQQAKREQLLAKAQADAEAEVQVEAEAELRAELEAKGMVAAEPPPDAPTQAQGAEGEIVTGG